MENNIRDFTCNDCQEVTQVDWSKVRPDLDDGTSNIEIYQKENSYAYYGECSNCGNLVEIEPPAPELEVTNVDVDKSGMAIEITDKVTNRSLWLDAWKQDDEWTYDFNQYIFHLDDDNDIVAKLFQEELGDYADEVFQCVMSAVEDYEDEYDKLQEAKPLTMRDRLKAKQEGKFTTPEQDKDFKDFLNGIKAGDKIEITYTEDEDLGEWLDDQDTNIVEVEDIDYDSQAIFIKGCDYAINTYTLTNFKKVVDEKKVTESKVPADVIEYFGMQDNTDEDYKQKVADEYSILRKKYPSEDMILNGDFGTYLGTENAKPIETGKYITVYKKDECLKKEALGSTTSNYWNGNGEYQDLVNKINEKLLPEKGSEAKIKGIIPDDLFAKFVELQNEYHRLFNDGDIPEVDQDYFMTDNTSNLPDEGVVEAHNRQEERVNDILKTIMLEVPDLENKLSDSLTEANTFGIAEDMYDETHKDKWQTLSDDEKAEFYNDNYDKILKKAEEIDSKKVTENDDMPELPLEMSKSQLYDELSAVLTDYEGNGDPELKDNADILYDMLVKIQTNWEAVITRCDESKKVTESKCYEIHFKFNEEDEAPEGYSKFFKADKDVTEKEDIIALAKTNKELDEDDLADIDNIDYAKQIDEDEYTKATKTEDKNIESKKMTDLLKNIKLEDDDWEILVYSADVDTNTQEGKELVKTFAEYEDDKSNVINNIRIEYNTETDTYIVCYVDNNGKCHELDYKLSDNEKAQMEKDTKTESKKVEDNEGDNMIRFMAYGKVYYEMTQEEYNSKSEDEIEATILDVADQATEEEGHTVETDEVEIVEVDDLDESKKVTEARLTDYLGILQIKDLVEKTTGKLEFAIIDDMKVEVGTGDDLEIYKATKNADDEWELTRVVDECKHENKTLSESKKVADMDSLDIIMELEGGELLIQDYEDWNRVKSIAQDLCTSQGFYGRLLRNMQEMEEAYAGEKNLPYPITM